MTRRKATYMGLMARQGSDIPRVNRVRKRTVRRYLQRQIASEIAAQKKAQMAESAED